MARIQSISARAILNSHARFTTEFAVRLSDGSVGLGGSPAGETISIYEDRKVMVTPGSLIESLRSDGRFDADLTQADFDGFLEERLAAFGRNNAFGLSLAFFNATRATRSLHDLFGQPGEAPKAPRLCLNILNGGWHAYTNPVLSDFSEFMLVAKSDDLQEVLAEHADIQRVVRERQLKQEKAVISGNPVNRFATADNRCCIEFLLEVCESLGLGGKYELMIDASAGDLWTEAGYKLAITSGRIYSSEAFHEYWLDLIRQYGLRFLEDPFREQDPGAWKGLTAAQADCHIIGDNYYSSDAARLEAGAGLQHTHGVVLKPNQAGTVTAIRRTAEVARRTGQIGISSHRSISTEETFISVLTCLERIPYIKIGPLLTDYSSVVRLNEIIRLTEQ